MYTFKKPWCVVLKLIELYGYLWINRKVNTLYATYIMYIRSNLMSTLKTKEEININFNFIGLGSKILPQSPISPQANKKVNASNH